MRDTILILALLASAAVTTADAPPATAPGDPDVDYLLSHAKPASATKDVPPASQPSPFLPRANPEVRRGTVTLSNGEQVVGDLSHTAEKPIRVWVETDQQYQDIPFRKIISFQANVTAEALTPEWHFKQSGSDVKEFTGKAYPTRETSYTITLANGKTITGGIVEPIYLARPGEDPHLFSLLKRDKGTVGQALNDLVYVKRIEFVEANGKSKK